MDNLKILNGKKISLAHNLNIFVDTFLQDAPGDYVKIYLYILRCLENDNLKFSIFKVAKLLDRTEKYVVQGLSYWEKAGLILLDHSTASELSGIYLKEFTSDQKKTNITNFSEQLSTSCSEEELKDLLFAVQVFLGRPLTATDLNTLLYWHVELGFSTELIEFLVEVSIDKGYKSIKAMNTIALNWSDKEISSVEQAKKII